MQCQPLPRMRTTKEIVDHFKEVDPNTQISIHFIRNVIEKGFPVVRTGRKILINLDLFIEYLNGSSFGSKEIDNKGRLENETV